MHDYNIFVVFSSLTIQPRFHSSGVSVFIPLTAAIGSNNRPYHVSCLTPAVASWWFRVSRQTAVVCRCLIFCLSSYEYAVCSTHHLPVVGKSDIDMYGTCDTYSVNQSTIRTIQQYSISTNTTNVYKCFSFVCVSVGVACVDVWSSICLSVFRSVDLLVWSVWSACLSVS